MPLKEDRVKRSTKKQSVGKIISQNMFNQQKENMLCENNKIRAYKENFREKAHEIYNHKASTDR